MARLDGSSLFAGIYSGLTNTYSLLAQQYPNGITLENLSSNEAAKTLTSNSMNSSFKQYLQTNFSNIDKDGDGIIGSDEITDLTNKMSQQGLTRDQITQLAYTNGYSSETVEKILTHFDSIDTNHDGRVTNAEIQAFGITSEKENKLSEYLNQKATNMSVFYGSESSDSSSSTSLLDYKYLKDES